MLEKEVESILGGPGKDISFVASLPDPKARALKVWGWAGQGGAVSVWFYGSADGDRILTAGYNSADGDNPVPLGEGGNLPRLRR